MGTDICQPACGPSRNKLFSMDISAAFLKGMTFKQIAEITGEKLRSVQFNFPPADAWILQTLPGMEGYEHYTEVLGP